MSFGNAIAGAVAAQTLMWLLSFCLVVGAIGGTVGYAVGRLNSPPSAMETMKAEERLQLLKTLTPYQRKLLGINMTSYERKALNER